MRRLPAASAGLAVRWISPPVRKDSPSMFTRLARLSWKPLVAIAIAITAVTGVALAYTYTVVLGTPGNDAINESGKAGNFHVYAFQGSDTITGGLGHVTTGSHGIPIVNGFDLLYGDGKCSATPPGNDSYCDHPLPWLAQDWTDAATATDTITGGVGPEWAIGGGGSNVIKGSQTYDVITGGPHKNTITGSRLGGAIIGDQPGAQSNITLLATTGKNGYMGLIGIPNFVDVSNGTKGDVVKCSSPSNFDFVWADKGDTVSNCFDVIYSAPVFPPSTNANFPLPPGMGSSPSRRDLGETLIANAAKGVTIKVADPIVAATKTSTKRHKTKKSKHAAKKAKKA
jgi:hypothetical protein